MAGETVRTMYGDVIPVHSIYEESSSAKHRFGDRVKVGERIFHYCKNAAVTLAAGKLIQGAAPLANHLNRAVAAAVVAGALKVSVAMGATAAALNYYSEGWLHCNDVSPEGNSYKVKSHLAIAGSDTVWFNLYDPVIVTMSVSSEVTLTKNLYDSVIIAPNAALTAAPVGVPIIAITASYYFWAQTWGTCAVLTQGTVVIGQKVGLGGTADGAIGPITAATTVCVGTVMQVNVSTEYSLINLTLQA
mgnify:CR=1 FL=1